MRTSNQRLHSPVMKKGSHEWLSRTPQSSTGLSWSWLICLAANFTQFTWNFEIFRHSLWSHVVSRLLQFWTSLWSWTLRNHNNIVQLEIRSITAKVVNRQTFCTLSSIPYYDISMGLHCLKVSNNNLVIRSLDKSVQNAPIEVIFAL